MENKLQIFNHEEFGRLRTFLIDGEPWAVGKDVAVTLGYKDTVNALKAHVDEEDKRGWRITTPGGVQEMTIINESGLYSLILSSKLPKAKEFKRWVTSEVLPSIRKTGYYSAQSKVPTPIGDAVADVKAVTENIQALFEVKRGIAISQAIDLVGINTDLKLDSLKQLLPPADHETGFMNATQLGAKLGGLNSRKVNKLLADAKFQYRDGKHWRITENGAAYGEEMPFTRNGHSGYQIRWNERILNALSDGVTY